MNEHSSSSEQSDGSLYNFSLLKTYFARLTSKTIQGGNIMQFSNEPVVLPIVSSMKLVRILNIGVMVVAPTIYFALAFGLIPGWQSGKLEDYAALLLLPETTFIFSVLLIYSMSSFVLIQLWPEIYSKMFFIRLGIYTGTILSLQYSVLAIFFAPRILIFGAVLIGIYWIIKLIKSWKKIVMIFAFLIVILTILFFLPESIHIPFLSNVLIDFIASPTGLPLLCLNISFVYSWKLIKYIDSKEYNFGLKIGFIGIWSGAYAAAWRSAILKMFEVYQTLPKTNPNCYIVTVAAKGHPKFVGSQKVGDFWVNKQLQTYKAIELAMMAVVPGVHTHLRRTYDLLGPKLARMMDHPTIADIAYLLLKPAELLGHKLLILFMPECENFILQIYKKETVVIRKY